MYTMRELIASELTTTETTRRTLAGVARNYPEAIDILLSIPQLTGHSKDDQSQNTIFYWSHYLQAHATVRCIYRDYETGYYLEAMILIRHLLEAFIQMRFFRKHPDMLTLHITQTKRVRFRTMFDEFSPGYYEKYYGRFLSEFAHGMSYKLILRSTGPIQQDGGKLTLGNYYNARHSTLVINSLTAVLSGYFNQIDSLLPNNNLSKDPDVGPRFQMIKDWLNNAMDALEKTKSGPIEWFDHCRKLFR